MSEKLFRENSLKKVTSPEELNDYVKVANPGVWLLLAGIIALLVGFIIWSVYGRLDTFVNTLGVVNNSELTVYVKESDIEKIDLDTVVTVEDKEYKITSISPSPIKVDDNFTDYMLHVGEMSKNEWVYEINCTCALTNGVYPVQIVVDSIKPISFVIN